MNLLKRAVIGIILNGLALYGLVTVLPEITYSGGVALFVLGGFIMGLLNVMVKPIIKLLSLPLVLITGGMFLIVINAAMLWFLEFVIGVIKFRDVALSFPNLGSYVIAAVVIGLINWGIHLIIKNKGE